MATSVVGTLFTLPQAFFEAACVRGEAQAAALASEPEQPAGPAGDEPAASAAVTAAFGAHAAANRAASHTASASWRESGATCLTCGVGVSGPGFASAAEQRAHFKTDWHRFNIKRRLAKQGPLTEEAFERVLHEAGTEVSISGSETESSDDEDEGAADAAEPGTHGGGEGRRQRKGQQQAAASTIPRETFQAADGSCFSVWRCLLRQDHVKAAADQPSTPGELLGELQRLRRAAGCWVVVLLRGGHFAATVFRAKPSRPSATPSRASDGEALEGFEVVAHKTFHRYVVRAKAGGKQSSKDATGKYARSAGSQLRRYNESALERDVQELLASWAPHVAAADLLFVHAPASNARSLFSEGQTTLVPSNPRLRRVPFVTRRPTFSETKRVLRLLASVFRPEAAELLLQQRSAEHGEEEAAAAAAALAAVDLNAAQPEATSSGRDDGSGGSAAAGPAASAAATSAPDAAAAPEALAAAASAEGPLHRAAKAGDPERVKRLLESGHDPTAKDGKGRTPYALAADKDTRDAFRRFMAQQPDRWDYAAAGVPSPLTEEMEAAAQAKKAAHKAKLKAKTEERKGGDKGPGPAAGGDASADARKRAAAEAEAAARRQAVDDEIAVAAAEAAAIAARLNASAKPGGKGASGSKRGGTASALTTAAAEPDAGAAGGGPLAWVARNWPAVVMGGLFVAAAAVERQRRRA